MSLWSDFLTNQHRVIDKWTHYFPAYERHFSKFVNTDVTFLEIGCFQGGSLQMWKRYLGPYAKIVGIDIDPTCMGQEEDQISVRIGRQADTNFLQSVIDEFGPIDVVLDDGSHMMSDLRASFNYLYPHVSRNGVYFIEDLHTAYWEEFGGGLRREGSFIELCKNLIDDLNADWSRGANIADQFTRSTLSMHFYDSICAFEKGRTANRTSFRTGDPGAGPMTKSSLPVPD